MIHISYLKQHFIEFNTQPNSVWKLTSLGSNSESSVAEAISLELQHKIPRLIIDSG